MGSMDKALEIQLAARDSVQNLKSYLTDLGNWEKEMKRKEAALRGDFEQQELPPVRSKSKKERPVAKVTEKKPKINKPLDYAAWDKFDADAACEEVDMCEVGPKSLDGKRSQIDKQAKLIEEAQYEKDRGNAFVKQEKWDEAVQCYNRAIELINNNAIYYANRGLCHLKKERLQQAESDCTAALKLDPSYVKAYQRRAAAREKLGSLRTASHDLIKVIELEPGNNAARNQLASLKLRMATKGGKFKSSPATTPTENKTIDLAPSPKIVELPDSPPHIEKVSTKVYAEEDKSPHVWPGATGDNVQTVMPVEKPPHLRSKKPLRLIPIKEIQIGETEPKLNTNERGDSESVKSSPDKTQKSTVHSPVESNKLANESVRENGVACAELATSETLSKSGKTKVLGNQVSNVDITKLVAPANSVQFITDWNNFNGDEYAMKEYLNIISPQKIPSIFQNSLESVTLSDILRILSSDPKCVTRSSVKDYLQAFTRVKRFGALAMFLSESDKLAVRSLLKHCQIAEGCQEEELNDLRNKFEL